MLANRQGHGDAFAELDSFGALEDDVSDGVIDDDEYLEESGLDVSEVDAAGDRDPRGSARSGSKKEIVQEALRELERPTEARSSTTPASAACPPTTLEMASKNSRDAARSARVAVGIACSDRIPDHEPNANGNTLPRAPE